MHTPTPACRSSARPHTFPLYMRPVIGPDKRQLWPPSQALSEERGGKLPSVLGRWRARGGGGLPKSMAFGWRP